VKKKSAFTVKELFFGYLAINKLMYWIGNINAIQQDELGVVWRMILERFLLYDILTIWILVAMYLLEHYVDTHPAVTKGFKKYVLLYGIGYVIYIVSIVGYLTLLGLFVSVEISNWFDFLFGFSIFFAIAAVVMNIKDRMKKKEAEIYAPVASADDDSESLLSILHERGVLTQDEYESKKAEIGKNLTRIHAD